jgi:hypothetical protein
MTETPTTPSDAGTSTAAPAPPAAAPAPIYERADGAKWALDQLVQYSSQGRWVLRTKAGGEVIDTREAAVEGVQTR